MLDARYLLFILILVTLFGVRAQQFGPVFNELPSGVTQCGNSQISWLGGVPPYTLSIVDPPSGNVLVSLEQTISRSFFGKIDIPAGTTILFRVTDSTGATSLSESIVVQNSEGNSCFGQPGGGTSVVGYTSLPPPQATTFQTSLSPSPSLSSAPSSLDPAAYSSSFLSSQSTPPPFSTFPPPQSTPPPFSTFPPPQSTPPVSQSIATQVTDATPPASQSIAIQVTDATPPFSISSPSSPLSQPSPSSFISQSTTIQGPSSSSLSSSTSLLSSSGSLTASSSSLTTSQPTNVPVATPPAPTTISTFQSAPSSTPSESATFQGSNLPPSPTFPSASRTLTSSSPPSIPTSGSSSDSTSAASGNRDATIARVIAGVLAAVLLITVAAYLLWRRRARRFRDEVHTMESQEGPRLLQRIQRAVRDSQPRPTVLSFPLPPDTLPTNRRDDRRQASGEAWNVLGADREPMTLKSPPGTPTLMVRPDNLRLSDP